MGEKIPEEILDDEIFCLGPDYKTELVGSDNCWAYWMEGQQVENHDVYLWLNRDMIVCTAGTGFDNCAIEREIECNSSKLERLGLTGDEDELICVPTFVFEDA